MGLSLLGAGFVPGQVNAAPLGSNAWFSQRGLTGSGVPAKSTAPGVQGTVIVPQQALIRAQQSITDLSLAAAAIANAQAAQNAARQLSLGAPGDVPDGLGAGGLEAAPGAAQDVAAPASCATTNTCVWQNAQLPTQLTNAGQTIVTVKQTAKKAILTWDSFNIGKKTTLDFDQSSGTQANGTNDWIALNRVSGTASPSQILGQIKADGSVYLINPNGIIFGGSSQINVHSLIASSLPLFSSNLATSNDTFLNQGIQDVGLDPILGTNGSTIVTAANQFVAPGNISIDAGAIISTGDLGFSLIAAPNVTNAGTIVATNGQAILAAGLGVSLKQTTGLTSSAATAQLQPVITGTVLLRNADGTSTDITPAGQVTNDVGGLIEAERGNITLLGLNVTQNGVLAASTSVTVPASINLIAEDEQSASSAGQGRTGSLVLGKNSVTALLPDEDKETTTSSAAASALFQTGTISLVGGSVTLNPGALVEAPGENVHVVAIAENDPGFSGAIRSGITDGSVVGRVYVDTGAIIDVAGLANIELPIADTLVTIPRLGLNELADSPLQRDGALFGQTITVSSSDSGTLSDGISWVGTPLANVAGYVQQVPRPIDQLLLSGGNIALSGGEVITRAGSSLNLDGGYIHYLGGIIDTTRLVAANGAIIDIAQADPNTTYIGIAGQYTVQHPRANLTQTYTNPLASGAGFYESDYVQGASAGTLSVYGQTTSILDGAVSAKAVAGRHQVASANVPQGGSFYAGAGNNESLEAQVFPSILPSFGTSYVVRDNSFDVTSIDPDFDSKTPLSSDISSPADTNNIFYWTRIPGAQLEKAGFSSITVAADDPAQSNLGGQIIVGKNSQLTVQPGGSINLIGSRVTILGDLTARAGSINVVATGDTAVVGTTLRPKPSSSIPQSGDIVVGQGVVLDTSGEWVNDGNRNPDQLTGGEFVNGGKISLQTQQNSFATSGHKNCGAESSCVVDTTGSIDLESGSLLNVSSGGRVLPSGKIAQIDGIVQGRGGDISLQTYTYASNVGPFGSETRGLPTTLPPDNGHIVLDGNLLAYGFSGGGTLTLRALGIQIGGDPATAASWDLVLPKTFFTDQGFGAYAISAEYDATVAAGTKITPTEANFIPDYSALLTAATGTNLYSGVDLSSKQPAGTFVSIGQLDDFHRQPTNFSLHAGDYLNWRAGETPPDYRGEGITGTLRIGSNAAILADPGASIVLESINQIDIYGSVVAHGGNITLSNDTGLGGLAQDPDVAGTNAYTSRNKSIWLGPNSLLDVSGVALVNPLQAPVSSNGQLITPVTGRVLDGGNVTITDDTGYVIAVGCRQAQSCEPGALGAQIDVSGTTAKFDLPAGGTSGNYRPRTVWSDAGSITVGAGAGLYFDATLSAHGGNSKAEGGTLSIVPEHLLSALSGFEGATELIVRNGIQPLPPGAEKPGHLVDPDHRQPTGVLDFSDGILRGSGITSLNLGTDPHLNQAALPIAFGKNVVLSLARSIGINASELIGQASPTSDGASGDSQVVLSAPYVSLHGYTPGGDYAAIAPLPVATSGISLKASANTIDIGGQVSLRNFADAEFIASEDLRFVTPSAYDYFSPDTTTAPVPVPGLLYSAGNLTFQAAQIYPATGNSFIIDAVGTRDADGTRAPTTVTFLGNENSAASSTPFSAGGALLVDATRIVQSGVLRAPSGEIVLGVGNASDPDTQALFSFPTLDANGDPTTSPLPLIATGSVKLTRNSITSVSLNGLVIPYGETVDGQDYQYNGAAALTSGIQTTIPNLTAPPAKDIVISGANVAAEKGATVDLSGGGDLQAQEFVPGTGGSRDVLSQFNVSYASGTPQQVPLYADQRQVYAILPGFAGQTPYDPALVTGDPLIGQSVYLSGAPGLPAGIYTLLPGKYATLPGAFRVVQDTSAIDTLSNQNTTLPDGTQLIAGHFVDSLDGSITARGTAFMVQSASVWEQYSEYNFTSANAYFLQQAQHAGTVVPLLPVDAGHLVLAASNTLGLGAKVDTSAGAGGVGAEIDIASQRVQIVGDTPTTALSGYVQISADALDSLDASSLLIGGTRTRSASGDFIDPLSNSVVVDNGKDTLYAPEIILVAKASKAGDGVTVRAGSTIAARGIIAPGADVPITIGRLPDPKTLKGGISGDGALLRVSDGAAVLVNRVNVPGIDGVAGSSLGNLRIGANADISGGASITLDSTGATLVDPKADFSAKEIDADARQISFVAADGQSAPGLVISPQLLAQFAGAEIINLSSRSSINFVGDVSVDLDNTLHLSAGSFGGDGTVSITAKTIALSNDLNASAAVASVGTGSLSLNAGEIDFGGGAKSLVGFDGLTGTASDRIVLQGVGSFDFGTGAVSLTTPLLLAATGASNSLTTTGALSIIGQANSNPAGVQPLGGSIDLVGGSVQIDTRLQALAGNIAIDATSGDLNLDAGAQVTVAGQAEIFNDVSQYASAGSITLTADHGNVIVPSGAVLDFSGAANGGDAGSLKISAPDQTAEIEGTLRGSAAAQNLGGSFTLDVGGAADLDHLASLLAAGGINDSITVQTRSGNLSLSADETLNANSITLIADAGSAPSAGDGNVVILGTLNASGAKGGDIDLFGRSGVDVEGKLLATASDKSQLGGNVLIGTAGVSDGSYNAAFGYENVNSAGSGSIVLGQNAVIDVSGGSAGGLSGGTVHLRAPLLDSGDVNVSIASPTQIIGARDVTLEAYVTWSTLDGTGGAQHFDGIIDPAGNFDSVGNRVAGSYTDASGKKLGPNGNPELDYFTAQTPNADHVGFYQNTLVGFVENPGFTFDNRFAGIANFHARPGIDLVNPDSAVNGGNISVLSNWNLGAVAQNANGVTQLAYRYLGSIAPVLTLRAAGNVEIDASLTDGFYQYTNPFGGAVDNSISPIASATNPLPFLTASLGGSSDSTSYRIVAGADVDSADPLAIDLAALSSGLGNVDIDGHTTAFYGRSPRSSTLLQIVAPTLIRTGTGDIDIAALQSVELLDTEAPGVIYTAGFPAEGTVAPSGSTIVRSAGHFPLLIDTGAVNADGAGDISITAGDDIVGIEQIADDSKGSRSGLAGNDLSQFWTPWTQRDCVFAENCGQTVATSSSINFGAFDQGVLSLGGDVSISAGHDIRDLAVSLPTSWYLTQSNGTSVVNTVGGGNLTVHAGGNILSGDFFVAKGSGTITAGGGIAADVLDSANSPVATLLALQDGQLQVSAVQSVDIGGVFDPSYLYSGFDSQSYSARSAVDIVSTSGDVTLGSLQVATLRELNFGGSLTANNPSAYPFVLPATLNVLALDGGITIEAPGELYPSSTGELGLYADQNVEFYKARNAAVRSSFLGLIDAPTSSLPSPSNPIVGNLFASFIDSGSAQLLHSTTPLHATDAQPVRIYSLAGDIIDGDQNNQNPLIVVADKAAQIEAGQDIVDLSFRGQNIYASDISLIQAGRDIFDNPLAASQQVPLITLGGIGTLDLVAGRDIGPITSANEALVDGQLGFNNANYPGIETVGNFYNPYLQRQGASIAVSFGVALGVDAPAFEQAYIDPASVRTDLPAYSAGLISFVEQYETDQLTRSGQGGSVNSLSATQAYADFQKLPIDQQQRFVYSVFFDVLNRTGLDFNNPASAFYQQYSRGYEAINTLFPASFGYTANDLTGGVNGAQTLVHTGTFDMRGSTLQTQQGGNISVLGPGGDILIGSTAAPPNVPATPPITAGIGPNNQGILTLEQGSISIFADQSTLLAQSRIFTEQGGDVLIWSSNGDINAGRGAKTASEIPPPDYACDQDHFCLVDAKSEVSGAGIAVLQTKPGAVSGNANLIAPRGTVDAGDAGIRVAGSLNVAALRVANADNIQVQGKEAGVPTGLVDSGALNAASSVNAAVEQTASQIAASRPQDDAASSITVEVIGLGGGTE